MAAPMLTVDDIRAVMEARRQAIMQELAELNKRLGYGPREMVMCPACKQKYNRKVEG